MFSQSNVIRCLDSTPRQQAGSRDATPDRSTAQTLAASSQGVASPRLRIKGMAPRR